MTVKCCKKRKLYSFAFLLKNEISVKLLNNPWIWFKNEISAIVIFSRKNENTELLFISEIFFYLTTAGRIFDQYKHLHIFYYCHNDIWCLQFIYTNIFGSWMHGKKSSLVTYDLYFFLLKIIAFSWKYLLFEILVKELFFIFWKILEVTRIAFL